MSKKLFHVDPRMASQWLNPSIPTMSSMRSEDIRLSTFSDSIDEDDVQVKSRFSMEFLDMSGISPWLEWIRNLASNPILSASRKPSTCGHVHYFDKIQGHVLLVGGYYGSFLQNVNTGERSWLSMDDFMPLQSAKHQHIQIPLNVPTGMKDNLAAIDILDRMGPLDICTKLIAELHQRAACSNGSFAYHTFPYDWRQELHLSVDALVLKVRDIQILNGKKPITVLAHSMGGLIAMSAANKYPELFKGIVFVGTPFGSAPIILWALRRGFPMMMSKHLLSADFTFATRSSFVFLPRDTEAMVDVSGDPFPIDYFDPLE